LVCDIDSTRRRPLSHHRETTTSAPPSFYTSGPTIHTATLIKDSTDDERAFRRHAPPNSAYYAKQAEKNNKLFKGASMTPAMRGMAVASTIPLGGEILMFGKNTLAYRPPQTPLILSAEILSILPKEIAQQTEAVAPFRTVAKDVYFTQDEEDEGDEEDEEDEEGAAGAAGAAGAVVRDSSIDTVRGRQVCRETRTAETLCVSVCVCVCCYSSMEGMGCSILMCVCVHDPALRRRIGGGRGGDHTGNSVGGQMGDMVKTVEAGCAVAQEFTHDVLSVELVGNVYKLIISSNPNNPPPPLPPSSFRTLLSSSSIGQKRQKPYSITFHLSGLAGRMAANRVARDETGVPNAAPVSALQMTCENLKWSSTTRLVLMGGQQGILQRSLFFSSSIPLPSLSVT
jgi:hypothetical protein